MKRTHAVLGGVLAVQVLLILLVRNPFANAHAVPGARALLPELAGMTVARLEVSGGEDEAVTLVLGDGGWGLEGADRYPVDESRVDRLLEALEAAEVRRPVVSSPRYHEPLEVGGEEHQRRVRAWGDSEETPAVDLFLGSSPGYRVTHVRRGDDDRVYAVSGLGVADAPTASSSWIDSRFMDVPPESVTAFRLENAAGMFELEKRDGTWTVLTPADRAGDALDAGRVDGLVRSVASLWIAGPAGRLDEQAQGLSEPAARVVLYVEEPADDASDGTGEDTPPATELREEVLRVGAAVAGEDGQRYVARDGFAWAARLRESSLTQLLEKRLDDLAAEPDGPPS